MPLSCFAIEGGSKTDCPKKKKAKEDTVGIYESENKVSQEAKIPDFNKEQVAEKSNTKKAKSKTFEPNPDESDEVGKDDPNSAMSFNFIYYIIDKFKFTDPLQ